MARDALSRESKRWTDVPQPLERPVRSSIRTVAEMGMSPEELKCWNRSSSVELGDAGVGQGGEQRYCEKGKG